MEFTLSTVEEIDEKTASHLLSLMANVLTDMGYKINYMEFNEMLNNHPIGDNSISEEIFFQSKITRKVPPPKQTKAKDCSKEVCVFEE